MPRAAPGCEARKAAVKTINVIGCGKVGKTLARLWSEHRVFQVRSILNRSLESGRQAATFVGGGRAIQSYAEMEKADLVMISASDEAIEPCCRQLCETGLLGKGVVVFHCSGSLPSTLLEPARSQDASIASIHPVKSFADPATAADSFAGTFCAMEGDPQACQLLREALGQCGATVFPIDAQFKTIYHAATVVVCNYLVALMEVGLRCFQKAGVSRETALEVIKPMVTGTVDNVFKLGPVGALTGPIARGERSVVERQCTALGQWDPEIQRVYKSLGRIAVELAAAQGEASSAALATIKKMLDR
jgi:predicted short-subunit dehydrogenase-like oxidoreductase (DUF2520 family)